MRRLGTVFSDYGVEGEVYVTAPGAEIEEHHELVQAVDAAHEQVFGSVPERDVTRWFSDASALTRYGIPTVNYGTSTGLMDVELGENLDIDGLVKTAETYAARGAGESAVSAWRFPARGYKAFPEDGSAPIHLLRPPGVARPGPAQIIPPSDMNVAT